MLSRVVPFAMRGVVWYQGESSAAFRDCAKYGRQMRVLIRDWRRAFENDGLAFVQTQLAGYDTSRRADPCDWPAIREAQRRLCHTETNVFIANLTGLGELRNIHPVYKIEAGRRLADAALRHVYAQDCPVAPEAEWAAREGEWLRVAFCHGEDLRAAGEVTQLETGDGETWTPAKEFRVEGGTLAVRTGANRVRYGWRCDPEGSLQNAAGLPVTPFEIAVKENTPYELD
jgi:sialate O-acetylesterase